jgi:hypothetical protein
MTGLCLFTAKKLHLWLLLDSTVKTGFKSFDPIKNTHSNIGKGIRQCHLSGD